MHLTYRYILLEIIRYTLFSNTRLHQFNSIPTYLKFQSYSYILYTFSLSLGDIYPPSIISSFDYILLRSFSVVCRGHSRSLIQGKNTFFFSLLAKRGSTEKEKKNNKKGICWLVGSLSREKEGMEAFVSIIEKRKYPPTFPAYLQSSLKLEHDKT